jgi:TonB family protein
MLRASVLIAVAALFATLGAGTSAAQTQSHAERGVINRIAPSYPEAAKRMHVGGVVKLEVIVAANGRVESARALGGNPVLIESASYAVQKWKFQAAPQETTEVVKFVFELPQ